MIKKVVFDAPVNERFYSNDEASLLFRQKSPRLLLAKQLLGVATLAVKAKERLLKQELRRLVTKQVHLKQSDEAEREIARAMEALLRSQFADAAEQLGRMGGEKRRDGTWVGPESTPNYHELVQRIRQGKEQCAKCGSKRKLLVHHRDGNSRNDSKRNLQVLCDPCHRAMPDGPHAGTVGKVKAATDASDNLALQVFNPRAWDRDLFDTMFPVLLKAAGEAAAAQMLMMGVDVLGWKRKSVGGVKFNPNHGPDGRFISGHGGGILQTPGLHTPEDAARLVVYLEERTGLHFKPHGSVSRGNTSSNDLDISIIPPTEEELQRMSDESNRAESEVWSRVTRGEITQAQAMEELYGETKDPLEEALHDLGFEYQNTMEWTDITVHRYSRPSTQHNIEIWQQNLGAFNWSTCYLPRVKSTTATQWFAQHGTSDELQDVIFDTALGPVNMRFMTEWPEWMKKSILEQIQECFEQEFWDGINDTTLSGIEYHIRTGLEDGLSINQIAEELRGDGLNEYYHGRAKNIARTEAGNALNGARRAAMDQLAEEVPGLVMQKTWLSVLGTTTRDTHANLDGVPADKDGLWYLGGVRVPWPGHWALPVGERANCQCTIVQSYGMSDTTAEQLIEEYNERTAFRKAVWDKFTADNPELAVKLRRMKFNPNHGSDGRFSSGGSSDAGQMLQDRYGLTPSQAGWAAGMIGRLETIFNGPGRAAAVSEVISAAQYPEYLKGILAESPSAGEIEAVVAWSVRRGRVWEAA